MNLAAAAGAVDELVVYAGLKLGDQIRLDGLAANVRGLTFEELWELRGLVADALGGCRLEERRGLTLDQRIRLRGLAQAADVEQARRHGDVRNGGRDSRPRTRAERELSRAMREGRMTPEQRGRVVRALRVVARGYAKEAEWLGYGVDVALERQPPARRPMQAQRRVRARSRSRSRSPGRLDPERPSRPLELEAAA